MGVFDIFRTRGIDWDQVIETDLFKDTASDVHLKWHALQTCISMIGRTISQSEFQTRINGNMVQDEAYYRLNVRPNKNMSAHQFWSTVVWKMIMDNECLIIKTDEDELLIADDFDRTGRTLFDDSFTDVVVGDITFRRTFEMKDVIYLPYANESVSRLVDGLYESYGELFARIMEYQYRKGQIRSIVNLDAKVRSDDAGMNPLQNFINKIYETTSKKVHAVIPSQKGIEYDEKQTTYQPNVDEVEKVAKGFLEKVAIALGIPLGLLRGDLADVEKQTENYMTFCINPFLDRIRSELNGKLLEPEEFLRGDRIKIRAAAVENLFSVAMKADKLVSSGLFKGNEIREELGFERSDDPMLDKHLLTKNYQLLEEAGGTTGGGDNG